MTAQTIPEYLEEERQKATDTQLRTEEEAARIQPLQHGRHRKGKQHGLILLPQVKRVTKRKKERQIVAVARQKRRAGRKTMAKTNRRRERDLDV
jgi:hypothetical protein